MNFKLTIFPAMELKDTYMTAFFETKEEMLAAENTCADLLLFMQDKAKIMDDYSNMFCKEEKDGCDWTSLD